MTVTAVICRKGLESFTIRPYRMKRLETYRKQMGKDNTHVLVDDHVKDALLAQGYSTEDAPRSVYKVDKLFEALSHYAPSSKPFVKSSRYLDDGISLAYKCFARKEDEPILHCLPMTPETIIKVTSNPTGSPGLTNYGCTKAESQTRALERGLQTLKNVKAPEPCLAFKRTQFNDKTRLVWGYPYSMTVIEGLIAYPLLQRYKRGNTPMAFAMTSGALGTKLRVSSYHSEWAYSFDMSQFDATISAYLINLAFGILKTWFDLEEIEPISGVQVMQIFKRIEAYFVHTPIVMPDGQLYLGKQHGVPSGSYFTQIIDSIVNVIIAGAISSRFNLNVSRKEIFVLGDDLLMWSNRRMDLDVIARFVNYQFGVKMHGSEKSAVFHYDEIIHFLGRDWDRGLPSLDVDEILKRMIYPESFRKYSKDPVKLEREVRMLLLAYASTYRAAWKIASEVLDPSDRNIHCGCANMDVNTYGRDGLREMNPDHLSGLLRYQMKYGFTGRDNKDIPNTAVQYWL